MIKLAAVVVIYELYSNAIIVTKRHPGLGMHPGEICFPGGLQEEQDASLQNTGLRELSEELGISEERLQFIRKLDPVRTASSNVVIHPWLASLEVLEPLLINSEEVTAIIKLPLLEVLDRKNYQELRVEFQGKVLKTWQYMGSTNNFFPAAAFPEKDFGQVWGATATIMRQLSELNARNALEFFQPRT